VLWEPLFKGKFGKRVGDVSAAWFWARIKKRSASLGYPIGGFDALAWGICKLIQQHGGQIVFKAPVSGIKESHNELAVIAGNKTHLFDKIVSTLPFSSLAKVVTGFPSAYVKRISKLPHVAATNLVLSLKRRFFADGTYWLNINEANFPVLAVVEHTAFVDKKYYNDDHLIYVGNYLETSHKHYKCTKSDLMKEYLPFLRKVNPEFEKSWIKKTYLFKDAFAQPIHPLNYSKSMPSMKTPIDGLFTANMQQVYPWDRGTNYAVEMGEKVAKLVLQSDLQSS
jgi:protoporphyrinogen oxidase